MRRPRTSDLLTEVELAVLARRNLAQIESEVRAASTCHKRSPSAAERSAENSSERPWLKEPSYRPREPR
jgi:hypothetical protein